MAFLGLAVVEHGLTFLILRVLNIASQEYPQTNYTSFRFTAKEDAPNGANVLVRMFFPVLFVLLVAGTWKEVAPDTYFDDFYLVTLFYLLLRCVLLLLFGRGRLIRWGSELVYAGVAFGLSWVVVDLFINKVEHVFPSSEEIKNGVWLWALTMALGITVKIIFQASRTDHWADELRARDYIDRRYRYFSKKFGGLIERETKNADVARLAYAVMIYEDYNRPWIVRPFEYLKLLLTGRASVGVAQFTTERFISNAEALVLAVQKLQSAYNDALAGGKTTEEAIKAAIGTYNRGYGYVEEVYYIYGRLKTN